MEYVPPINGDTGDPDRSYINANPGAGQQGSIPAAEAIEHPIREIVNVIEEAGLTPDGGDLTQLYLAIVAIIAAEVVDTDSFGNKLLHVRDEKSSGTNGGTITSGAWRTNDLNTTKTAEISGASVGSNQIVLPAGTYYAEYETQAHDSGTSNGILGFQSRLQNITDGTTAILGTNSHVNCGSDNSDGFTAQSSGRGRFTIAGTKTFEVQSRVETTSAASNALGRANSFGTEVYRDIRIWKVA